MSASQYYSVTARVGVPHRHEVEVTVPLVGPAGPAGEGSVESVNGQTGVVVLDAQDVGAEVGLEYISQAINSSDNINAAVNKFYTLSKNVSSSMSVRLPASANTGDRVVVFRALGDSVLGVIKIDKPTGLPLVPFASIGVLRAANEVFYAVYTNDSWRADFIPPSGFQSIPTSVSDFGVSGQMAYQDPHLYICVSTNTWRRVTLTTF
jgi:hypothetical protein